MDMSKHSPTPIPVEALSLYREIYRTANLYSAWLAVRRKARVSGHAPTRAKAGEIDENPVKFVKSLQRKLSARKFEFPPQRAVIKTSAKGKKRGIVVSPIEGRVVQRAILEVLQSEDERITSQIQEIRSVLECPTSVGGIPKRGVQYAVHLISTAIAGGAVYYARSDIKGFFDHVNRLDVIDYVATQVPCSETVDLIAKAMTTELANEAEVRNELSLFPSEDIGVAQGNSLSCLAANVALRDFDKLMTGRGVTTIRYIDDFVVLGRTEKSVRLALESGIELLKSINLTAYSPGDGSNKASKGRVAEGFDFVGCYFKGSEVAPSLESRNRLIAEVEKKIFAARKDIAKGLYEKKPRRSQDRFIQTIAALDRKVRGWGDAYQFSTNTSVFEEIDEKLDLRIGEFRKWFANRSNGYSPQDVRRAYGFAVLTDTPRQQGSKYARNSIGNNEPVTKSAAE